MKQIKIELIKAHSIRGKIQEAKSTHVISEGVADDLIARGIAKKAVKKKD
jgi:hypothetical protein